MAAADGIALHREEMTEQAGFTNTPKLYDKADSYFGRVLSLGGPNAQVHQLIQVVN